MARYIDADAVKKMVADIMSDCKVTHKHRALNRNLKQIPTADVVEVKHGEWVGEPSRFNPCWNEYYCSVCKARFTINPRYEYCPRCGTKMDGGKG